MSELLPGDDGFIIFDEIRIACRILFVQKLICVREQAGKTSAADLLSTIRTVSSKSKTFNAMFDAQFNDIHGSETDHMNTELGKIEHLQFRPSESLSIGAYDASQKKYNA